MLNPFPVMYLSLLAHAFLRIVLGSVLLYLGARHLFRYRPELRALIGKRLPRLAPIAAWSLGISEIVIGSLFFLGLYTQIAAIASVILSIKLLFFRGLVEHHSIPPPLFYILVFAISISLFITGAGLPAFDLPL